VPRRGSSEATRTFECPVTAFSNRFEAFECPYAALQRRLEALECLGAALEKHLGHWSASLGMHRVPRDFRVRLFAFNCFVKHSVPGQSGGSVPGKIKETVPPRLPAALNWTATGRYPACEQSGLLRTAMAKQSPWGGSLVHCHVKPVEPQLTLATGYFRDELHALHPLRARR